MGQIMKFLFSTLLLVSCLFISVTATAAKSKLQIGDIPPSYLGKDTEGQKFYIEDHKGKVIVVSFWASWCAPCRKELPVLAYIQKSVSKDRFMVVAVNFKEDSRTFRAMRKQLADLKITITRDKRGKIGRKFGVNGIPHLLVIGKDGKIAHQAVGYGEDSVDRLVKILNTQLAKPM